MNKEQRQFRVSRYKKGQVAPTYQTFTVTVGSRTTIADALQNIRRSQDNTLTFRHSCLHASCGTCGMKVNGQEALACVTNVLALGTLVVVVEPIDNAPLVSDLVVDMGDFYGRLNPSGRPLIQVSEFLPAAATPNGVEQYTRYENCLECGLCVSACPVVGSDPLYLGPAALAAAWRVWEEPRGNDRPAALRWVDNEHGCWRCHVAYECSEVCPSDVDPAGKIMALRQTLARQKVARLFGRGTEGGD